MANYYGPDSINRTGNESAYCSEDECCNEDEQQYGAGTSRCSTSTPLSPASCCWQESGQESTLLPSREIEVEVAIIGNGPSAIFLSLLLSGYKPYFNGRHPNEILKSKLQANPGLSLLEQDIQYLSEGLEGRSTNPVSLLFDTLFHPDADMGVTHPSAIDWIQDHTSWVSHVVLGRGRPGGVWHNMDPSVLTLSKKDWLDLPIYSYKEWKNTHQSCNAPPTNTMPTTATPTSSNDRERQYRTSVNDIAKYYHSYVTEMKLGDNFIDGVCVKKVEQSWETNNTCTSSPSTTTLIPDTPTTQTTPTLDMPVSPIHTIGISSEGGVVHCPRCCCDWGVSCPTINHCSLSWVITSCTCTCCRPVKNPTNTQDSMLTVRAKKLVLACGLSKPKRLGVPGEELCYVLHDLSHLRTKCHLFKGKGQQQPMLVIGAGMSAADAILYAIERGVHVYHAFYQSLDDSFIFNKLPNGLYKEYHHIWHLMQGLDSSPLYTPLPRHRVTSFHSNGKCTLLKMYPDKGHTPSEITLYICAAVVAIGSQANLDFLPNNVKSFLGVNPGVFIDSKHNPLDVDFYTSQSERFPNLYALGPLVGDHFVRFVFGSGLACARDILLQK